MRWVIKWVYVCLLASVIPVYAVDARSTAPQDNRLLIATSYLSPGLVLPPPPETGTPKAKSELLEVKRTAAGASAEQRRLATSDALTQNVGFFSDTVKGFNIDHLPLTKALFDQVRYTEAYEAKVYKGYFVRQRPYVLDPTIVPCTETSKDWSATSYPSGHTTMAFSMGVILANLIPEQATEILSRAKMYAENRIVCGVHYRSDIVGGQVLGTLVALQLLQNAEFRQQMDAAKAELRAEGLTH